MTTEEAKAVPAERTDAQASDGELSSRGGTGADAQEPAPLTGTVAAPPDNPRDLEREIERTREQLGETVEELIARVDVKSRAQAKATELSDKFKSTLDQARKNAATRAGSVRGAVTKGAGGARERWVPLAVAAGVVIAAGLAVCQWKARRSRGTG